MVAVVVEEFTEGVAVVGGASTEAGGVAVEYITEVVALVV
jgi:hypothetical protein